MCETVEAAILLDDLPEALHDPIQKLEIKAVLLERSIPGKLNALTKTPGRFWESVKQEILYDPSEKTARNVICQQVQMETFSWEEKLILPRPLFKKAVVEV